MSGDISQAALNLTPEEKRVYGQLFKQADTEGLGVVTGDIAVKFFERTKLDAATLGEIWQIADTENRGLLTPAGFGVALRLIGHCQNGAPATAEMAKRPGPLPKFDGAAVAGAGTGAGPGAGVVATPSSQRPATPLQAQNTGGSISSQPTGGPIRVPPLTPDKVAEYQSLFDKAGARNGLLGGDAAKQIFEKARLPNEVLGRIWTLADAEQRGALNLTEFIIAMHLLTSMRNGSLRALPQVLPAGLYEAANRRTSGPAVPSGIPRQFTGGGSPHIQSPLSRSSTFAEITPQTTGTNWLVTPQDKMKFDSIFSSLDKAGIGYLSGEQAVQFFSNSGLPEDTLASIWDLADMRSEGRLNKDEFAVAMYLIQQQRGKTDGRGDLPSQLPAGLIPPSLRQQQLPPSQPTAPAFNNAAFATEQPRSASEDLFGLDAMAGEPPINQINSNPLQPMLNGPVPQSAKSPPPPITSNSSFRPFQPTSSFGQGLAVQNTGSNTPTSASNQAKPMMVPPPSAANDLLGDNDPEVSSKLTDETTELANISNQVRNLRTQTQELQTKKTTTEANLSSTLTQKRGLETRLAQLRSQYEQEIREVKGLEERLATGRNETSRLQQELAMLDGSSQDLRNQHQQTATELEANQRENSSLRERTTQVNGEVIQLRKELEKMKSDLRQQKGLVAISKKQLATSEGEREKVQNEMTDVRKEQVEAEATLQAARQVPLPGPASPAPGTPQPTNPFMRRTQPGIDRTMSPLTEFGGGQRQNDFDSFFGPISGMTSAPAPDQFQAAEPVRESLPVSPPNVISPPAMASGSDTSDPWSTLHEPANNATMLESSRNALSSNDQDSSSSPQSTEDHFGSDIRPSSRTAGSLPSTNGDVNLDISQHITDSADGNAQLHDDSHERSAEPSLPTPLPTEEDMPGAFPDDTPLATPAPQTSAHEIDTSESEDEDHVKSTATAQPDYQRQSVAHTQAADTSSPDFFSAAGARPVNTSTRTEFPPIHELNNDDDDTSDDDFEQIEVPGRDTRGYDQTSGTVHHTEHSTQSFDTSGSADGIPFPNDSVAEINESSEDLPMKTNAQEAPGRAPAYEAFEDNSPATAAFNSSATSNLVHGQYQYGTPNTSTVTSPPPAPVKPSTNGADDFDSAFDDLAEAAEGDDHGPEFVSQPRSGLDSGFDTSFEQHAPSRTGTFDSVQSVTSTYSDRPRGGFSTFTGNATGPSTSSRTYAGPPNFSNLGGFTSSFTRGPPTESFQTSSQQLSQPATQQPSQTPNQPPFRTTQAQQQFTPLPPTSSVFTSMPPRNQTPTPQQPQSASSGSHDWEAMFSGLENSKPAPQSNGTGDSFGFNNNMSTSNQTTQPKPAASAQQRPQIGRALTGGTEHDDPILKSLTGMGYNRDDALKALERFDYNIDKAADYLSSQ